MPDLTPLLCRKHVGDNVEPYLNRLNIYISFRIQHVTSNGQVQNITEKPVTGKNPMGLRFLAGFIQTLESIHSSNFSRYCPRLTYNKVNLQPFRDGCLQGSAGFIAVQKHSVWGMLTKLLIDKERADDTCKVFTEAKLYDGVSPGLAVASFPAFSALQVMDEVMKIFIKCSHNIINCICCPGSVVLL